MTCDSTLPLKIGLSDITAGLLANELEEFMKEAEESGF